jgi:hypothetical protein
MKAIVRDQLKHVREKTCKQQVVKIIYILILHANIIIFF